jgi:hypothetical protein
MPRDNNRTHRRRHEVLLQVEQQLDEMQEVQESPELPVQEINVVNQEEHIGQQTATGYATEYATECWKALHSDFTIACELFYTETNNFMCPIMHESTNSATVDNIPSTWPVIGQNYTHANTARLPCSHVFFAPALALHFLASNMRCPVCRAGSSEIMDIAAVPEIIRNLYASKLQGLHRRTVEEEMTDIQPAHISQVLTELEVEMQMYMPTNHPEQFFQHHSATARTRIIFDEQHVQQIQNSMLAFATSNSQAEETDLPMTNFTMHRSFQRLICCILARHHEQNSGGMIRFALSHPLLPLTFRSDPMSVDDVYLKYLTSCTETKIPLYCIDVAGTSPLAFLRPSYCKATATTTLTIDVNIHMIINISTYVSDVIESIREGMRQHIMLNEIHLIAS